MGSGGPRPTTQERRGTRPGLRGAHVRGPRGEENLGPGPESLDVRTQADAVGTEGRSSRTTTGSGAGSAQDSKKASRREGRGQGIEAIIPHGTDEGHGHRVQTTPWSAREDKAQRVQEIHAKSKAQSSDSTADTAAALRSKRHEEGETGEITQERVRLKKRSHSWTVVPEANSEVGVCANSGRTFHVERPRTRDTRRPSSLLKSGIRNVAVCDVSRAPEPTPQMSCRGLAVSRLQIIPGSPFRGPAPRAPLRGSRLRAAGGVPRETSRYSASPLEREARRWRRSHSSRRGPSLVSRPRPIPRKVTQSWIAR